MTDSRRDDRAAAQPPSLFVDLTTITVDPAYVEASARAAASGRSPRQAGVALAVALLVVGAMLGVAAGQTRERAPAVRRLRSALLGEVSRRTAVADSLLAEQRRLRDEVSAARDRRLRSSATGRAIADRLRRLELAAAGLPVSGPGLRVEIDDADVPDATEEGRVHDRDLQDVVNALWSAGAEAIAVNGIRLSSLTAIRAAGQAILVEYRPISPPYVIDVLGDPDELEPSFADTAVARRLRTWEQVFGIAVSMQRRRSLTLPGALTTRLRHAEPVPSAGSTAPAEGGHR